MLTATYKNTGITKICDTLNKVVTYKSLPMPSYRFTSEALERLKISY
ncbi:hypothetical protein GARC_3736 [Paraglaciecola arctica BSs20135]|uniref:Uncharacterized protein n=1 Tax=Paraglaciecola arctica BSs20135 TaxID=493475 RepID=K6ZB73_9ALTE|nr:hypothetical protein GARC_3736 [Paraglaciecola arctica BSs20135]